MLGAPGDLRADVDLRELGLQVVAGLAHVALAFLALLGDESP